MKEFEQMKDLKGQGWNRSEVAKKLHLDRKTVRKYWSMSDSQFSEYLEKLRRRGLSFDQYKADIIAVYGNAGEKSILPSSVFDFLSEKYGALPAGERTLRNYLRYLRESGAIGEPESRTYKPVEPLAPGFQLQMDFGQEITNLGKAYLFILVWAHSRYKYSSVQNRPFTALDVIAHMNRAFAFFGGVPKQLVIDQDRTLVVAENAGDFHLTAAFEKFQHEMGFKLFVCRGADPESKGKVENLVKYVKGSFFSARTFENWEAMSESLAGWNRRANGKISQATGKVPAHVWEAEEKPVLLPLRASIFNTGSLSAKEQRKADNRSLISVSSNRYSVPSRFKGKQVEVLVTDSDLLIFDPKTGTEIARHAVSPLIGQTVVNNDHYRNKEFSQQELLKAILGKENCAEWKTFVSSCYRTYNRYFRDQAKTLQKIHENWSTHRRFTDALRFCVDNALLSARNLEEVLTVWDKETETESPHILSSLAEGLRVRRSEKTPEVEKRSIGYYTSLLSLFRGVL